MSVGLKRQRSCCIRSVCAVSLFFSHPKLLTLLNYHQYEPEDGFKSEKLLESASLVVLHASLVFKLPKSYHVSLSFYQL
jgi:hypothetical protein